MLSRIKRLQGEINKRFIHDQDASKQIAEFNALTAKVKARSTGVLKVVTAYQKGSFNPESVKGNVYNSTKTVFIKLA